MSADDNDLQLAGVRRALSDAGHVSTAEIAEIGVTAAVRKAITDAYIRGRKHVAEGVGERLREIAGSVPTTTRGLDTINALHELADELDPPGAVLVAWLVEAGIASEAALWVGLDGLLYDDTVERPAGAVPLYRFNREGERG